ncbi:rhodanese-like domain-containing protein [Dyadobacter psychrotolerans]|uniref:Rhodanese-like domain-containing protein n=1 Tax=Dyadobacter psychrotolerans TaxID=2541721 RepID=A0A4V2Z4D4_9BACT|nr:rhodanese-like domain-containing protein [Dyadobacter psychrotolerans]TDE16218.1 rhodanese-like domain-containing protein [Dyadobacter psychrotolerans]
MTKNTYSDISLSQMQEIIRKRSDAVLVDVREVWEFEEFNEGGLNIPLAEIREKRELVSRYKTIIVICTNGVRSKVAAMDYCRISEWNDKVILHVKGGIIESE